MVRYTTFPLRWLSALRRFKLSLLPSRDKRDARQTSLAPILVLAIVFTGPFELHAQTPHVADTAPRRNVRVIDIGSEIDLGMVSYVDRAVAEAEKDSSVLVLHVNTFGGRVDAATKIRDRILSARVPLTIAFIDKRAISAGALISMAAKRIVMSGGSTLGAATPIYSSGEKASEKVVSYMRAEMRTTAEQNHRDPRIAEAMVDESLGLDSSYANRYGIHVPQGKLLTLTTEDALKVGYADAEAENLSAALAAVGVRPIHVETAAESVSDEAVRFLTSEIISGLLIMIGMAGIFYTIKTGHFGWITIAALVALVLFFGGQYITSIAPIFAIVLFLGGIALLLIEVLTPVPTFGIAGVIGVLGIGLGLFMALAGDIRTLTPDRMNGALMTLAGSFLGVILLGALIIKYAPKAVWLRKFRNEATTADTSFYASEQASIVGKTGVTQTMLRPAGIVLLEDRKLDAVTNGEFLPPGTAVQVIRMNGNSPVVQAIEDAVITQIDDPMRDQGDGFGGRLGKSGFGGNISGNPT